MNLGMMFNMFNERCPDVFCAVPAWQDMTTLGGVYVWWGHLTACGAALGGRLSGQLATTLGMVEIWVSGCEFLSVAKGMPSKNVMQSSCGLTILWSQMGLLFTSRLGRVIAWAWPRKLPSAFEVLIDPDKVQDLSQCLPTWMN